LIDVVKIIISKHTPEKQQRSSKEAAKKKQIKEANHNDILRFVPFHHPTHHLHWAYDGLDIVVLL
jgi:hypothetical protein